MRKRSKGGGPRTAAGKAIASRNALRHGFAAATHQRPSSPDRVERLAHAIAGSETDPAVIAQAFKIATNEIMLSEIAAHKIWVVKRLYERYAVAFAEKDNSLDLGRARLMQFWLANRTIEQRLPEILRKYEPILLEEEIARQCAELIVWQESVSLRSLFPDEASRAAFVKYCVDQRAARITAQFKGSSWRRESDSIVPVRLLALLEEPEEPVRPAKNRAVSNAPDSDWDDRDDYEAFEAAIQDLLRLDRYEQRAWSRQKRAIMQLANLKLNARLNCQV